MKKKKTSKLSKVLKIVAAILLFIGIYTMVAQTPKINEKKDEATTLTAAVAAAENENARIQEDINALGTDEGVETIARTELGLVGAGEIVFEDVGN